MREIEWDSTSDAQPAIREVRRLLGVAARVAERFGDGVVFVSLAEVAEPERLGGALARAAGVTDAGSRRTVLRTLNFSPAPGPCSRAAAAA